MQTGTIFIALKGITFSVLLSLITINTVIAQNYNICKNDSVEVGPFPDPPYAIDSPAGPEGSGDYGLPGCIVPYRNISPTDGVISDTDIGYIVSPQVTTTYTYTTYYEGGSPNGCNLGDEFSLSFTVYVEECNPCEPLGSSPDCPIPLVDYTVCEGESVETIFFPPPPIALDNPDGTSACTTIIGEIIPQTGVISQNLNSNDNISYLLAPEETTTYTYTTYYGSLTPDSDCNPGVTFSLSFIVYVEECDPCQTGSSPDCPIPFEDYSVCEGESVETILFPLPPIALDTPDGTPACTSVIGEISPQNGVVSQIIDNNGSISYLLNPSETTTYTYTTYYGSSAADLDCNPSETFSLSFTVYVQECAQGTSPFSEFCTQAINLNAGWNLISFDLSPADNTVSEVFSSLQPNNLKYVTSYENGAITYSVDGPLFLNTLTNVINGSAYWVFVQNDDVLNLNGLCIDEDYRKPLNGGWNLVAYIPDELQPPSSYFADLIGTGSLAYVTGYNEGAIVYNPNGPAFLNTLQQLENGLGYWIKEINEGGKTTLNQTNIFSFINGKSNLQSGETIKVLNKPGEVITTLEVIENSYIMTTPIYGDDLTTTIKEGLSIGEELRFSWNQQISDVTTTFKGDYGIEKMVLEFNKVMPNLNKPEFKVSPNPTTGKFNIAFNNQIDQTYSIHFYDISGQLLKSLNKQTKQNVEVDLTNEPNGVYMIQFSGTDFTQMQKIIKH